MKTSSRDWPQAGLWDLIHFALLNWLSRENQIDWSRTVADSCSVRAVVGGGKRDRIRRIKLSVAASVTTGVVFRWPSGRRGPMATIQLKFWHCSTGFHSSKGYVEGCFVVIACVMRRGRMCT
jgi:hypothetical protein